jgi:hypothetical protein
VLTSGTLITNAALALELGDLIPAPLMGAAITSDIGKLA